jgi:branched-chain amino acid transport system substrate-binding protein
MLCAAGLIATLGAPAAFAAASGEPLKIGIIESFSGAAAAYGEEHHRGTQLALEEINQAGGFNGQPVQAFVEDDRSDPAAGINAAKKLIGQRKVSAIVGSDASLVTIAFSKENEKAKVPMVNGQAGSPVVTEQGYKYVWRVNVTDLQLDTKAVAQYLKMGKKKFAFLVENSDYGKPPTKAASDTIKAGGGEVTAYEQYNRGEADFKAQLTNIKNTHPDVLFVHGYYTEGSIIARQIKELGITAQVVVNMGQGVPKFAELAGPAAEGIVFPTHWLAGLPDERSKRFEAAFQAKYKAQPDGYEASTYVAVYTVLEAAKQGGGSSAANVQAGLLKLKNFDTVIGVIKFDAKNQNDGVVRFATFKNGKIVPL